MQPPNQHEASGHRFRKKRHEAKTNGQVGKETRAEKDKEKECGRIGGGKEAVNEVRENTWDRTKK